MVIDMKTDKPKKVEKMKTSKIINELYDFEDEKRGDELDEELLSRYPFNYYFKERFEEFEKEIEELKKLLRHDHKDGEIVIKL